MNGLNLVSALTLVPDESLVFPTVHTYYATGDFEHSDIKLKKGVPLFFESDLRFLLAPTAFCYHRSKSLSRSIASAKTVGTALKRWLNFCALRQVNPLDPMFDDITDWRDEMLEEALFEGTELTAGTVADYLEHIRGFYKWASLERLISWNPFWVPRPTENDDHPENHEYYPRSMWKPKDATIVPPRAIPKWATDKILTELPEYPYRLMALFSLATGARASEVARNILTNSLPACITHETTAPFYTISLRGKGGVIASVSVPIELVAKLIRYRDFIRAASIKHFRHSVSHYEEPPQLFITAKDGHAMSGRTLSKAWSKAKARAGLKNTEYDWHGTRHTYAYSMICLLTRENEALVRAHRLPKDILTTLAGLMRHRSTKSTQIYLTAFDQGEAVASDTTNAYLDSFL